ncbi:MAG: hypothetical protein R3C55_15905 [Parvularculaceae bacterium]
MPTMPEKSRQTIVSLHTPDGCSRLSVSIGAGGAPTLSWQPDGAGEAELRQSPGQPFEKRSLASLRVGGRPAEGTASLFLAAHAFSSGRWQNDCALYRLADSAHFRRLSKLIPGLMHARRKVSAA